MNTQAECFECGAPAEHNHHVIPRSLGGTKTIPLCERCRGLIHEKEFAGVSSLTKRALQRKQQQGERTGNVPYGYDLADDGRRSKKGNQPVALVANPIEFALIAEVVAMYDEGRGMTYRTIASELHRRGVKSKSGRPWNHGMIQTIINRSQAMRS